MSSHARPGNRIRQWIVFGTAVSIGLMAAFVFVGLYRWRNVWFARIVWGVHAMRTPFLIGGAFFASPDVVTPPAFYLTALVIVFINLWMLARAGWYL